MNDLHDRTAIGVKPQEYHLKDLYIALIAAQADMSIAYADKKGVRGKYASIESLKKAAEPALKSHGLAIHFRPKKIDGEWCYVGVLIHTSGQEVEGIMPYLPDDGVGKSLLQSYGSGQTYLERYLYRALTGVTISSEAEDPDDHVPTSKPRQLTEEQLAKLNAFITEKSYSPQSFIQKQLNFYKVTSLDQLTVDQATNIFNFLRKPKES